MKVFQPLPSRLANRGQECLAKTSKTGLKPHKNNPHFRVQEWASHTFCCLAGGLVLADILGMMLHSLFPDLKLTGAQLDLDLKLAFGSILKRTIGIMDQLHTSRLSMYWKQ